METFRVRLNCIDHYQSAPTKFDPILRNNVKPSQAYREPKVPVIRVFGSTETGQKVCAHIHGALPYLYIEYDGGLDAAEVGPYIYKLHMSVNHALAASYNRKSGPNSIFVARITLVKGIPFYGFYVGYRYFLKIYMLNPVVMTRLADLLRQGVVMRRVFQPYEAHLQYLLQWMTDFNLYGCDYIDCKKVSFRSPVPDYDEIDDYSHLWHNRSIPPDSITDVDGLPRVSHCALEVDIHVQDILNRLETKERGLHHDFVERKTPVDASQKLVHSMIGLWRDETRRRKSLMNDPSPGSSPFPPEVLLSMSAGSRDSKATEWIHEQEYKEKIAALIADEKGDATDSKVEFDTFIESRRGELAVKTAYEAVEDLFPENLNLALGLSADSGEHNPSDEAKDHEDNSIDTNRILNLGIDEDNDFLYDSDYDTKKETAPSLEELLAGQPLANLEVSKQGIQPLVMAQSSQDSNYSTATDYYALMSSSNSANFMNSELSTTTAPLASKASIVRPERDLVKEHLSYNHKSRQIASLKDKTKRGVSPPREPISSSNKRQKVSFLDEGKNADESNKEDSVSEYGRSVWNQTTEAADVKTSTTHDESFNKSDSQQFHFLKETLKSKQTKMQLKALNFPVVKDPQDPTTMLRLSQKSATPKDSFTKSDTPDEQLKSNWSLSQISSFEASDVDLDGSRPPSVINNVIENMKHDFGISGGTSILMLGESPPSSTYVTNTMADFNLLPVLYQDAYYSDEKDVPDRPRNYAGKEFKLESITTPFLPHFDATGMSESSFKPPKGRLSEKSKEVTTYKQRRLACTLRSWSIAEPPPTFSEVEKWMEEQSLSQISTSSRASNNARANHKFSQIEGQTQRGRVNLGNTQDQMNTSVQHQVQYMSTISLEIHVNTTKSLVPNPEEDEVQCLFWCLNSDQTPEGSDVEGKYAQCGIIVLSEDGSEAKKIAKQVGFEVASEASELDLLIKMVQIVRNHDPDILTGFEVHGSSWGYLIERARLKYDYNLCDEFSRMKSDSHGRFGKENDKWGFNNTSTVRVTGRHMINIWRAMRGELNLLQYTMENVVSHVLHRRIPHFSWADLTKWYTSGRPNDLAKVINYYVSRTRLDLDILESNELIPRTSEQARLLGVDFFSVFSRGSQFKVESLMFRIAKPENFLLVSPGRKQVGGQNALECLPLVMEPQSSFYTSPVLVLDFQSLYPSVMIAYNYCYSTYLGRINNWRGKSKMGFMEYKRQKRLLELLGDHINIAPNGMMYAKPEIRKSLLAKMLTEILETRIMVKSGMKTEKDDKILQALLNNRQLALKLIANVTYGYTSASFSGRMPCSEIADSIVQTGRETLERTIAFIHSVKRWGAEVVYGDTDSLFIQLKGRTKDQAFDVGEEISKTITEMNPQPVKLKFEKVYLPCVLLAKKRYVGFKYETRDQKEPEFDAKGIETVRRDGTPAEQKIEERALKILFRTADLSQVKKYFQTQCESIMRGTVSIQDFCFAREVRLGTYSDKGPPPPGALISTRRMLKDARTEPQYGERVPYVVITGAPGARLIDRCVAPEELLENEWNELDSNYYITKNLIPPLERIFNLTGANVRSWYDEMPKVQRIRKIDVGLQVYGQSKEIAANKKTLESYMKSSSCVVCKDKLEREELICSACRAEAPASLFSLQTKLSAAEKRYFELERICRDCSGISPAEEVRCDSKDCSIFYTRTKQSAHLMTERGIIEPTMKILMGHAVNMNELDW